MATSGGRAASMPVQGSAVATSSVLASLDTYRETANIDAALIPDNLKKDCVLFYTPDMEVLARKIAAAGQRVELGEIRWR